MPLYGPKITETEFKSGKNILASEHLQFIEAGATLDAKKFDKGFNDVGKLIAQSKDTGKFEPVANEGDLGNYQNFGILNVDFDNDGKTDVIAGEVIVRGSVYEPKLADEVSDEFKEKNPLIRYINQSDFTEPDKDESGDDEDEGESDNDPEGGNQ